MAYITIDGKDHEAKVTFKFDKKANAKYGEENSSGFMAIYLNLLQYEPEAVVKFWDCALAHEGDNAPTIDELEEALGDRIEKDGDIEPVTKEAFKVLDESGFYKKQVKTTFDMLSKEANKQPAKNETEEQKQSREESKQLLDLVQERREELSS